MNCQLEQWKPDDIQELLVNQVEEQSSLCDIIVKVGTWQRRFHKSVLGASPFFCCFMNDDFLENQTGIVDISIGTASAVDMALMFLYGKQPTISKENVTHLMNLADYLIIPNLKSTLIKWLQSTDISTDMLANLLHIGYFYDIRLPKLNKHIKSNLNELFQVSDKCMHTLPKEYTLRLLRNKRLSYVPMDDKFRFLIKWIEADLQNRVAFSNELIKCIDFSEITPQCFEEQQRISTTTVMIDILKNIDHKFVEKREVIVLIPRQEDNLFRCFDYEMNKWYRLPSQAYLRMVQDYGFDNVNFTGVNMSKRSSIFFKANHKIHCIDLITDTYNTYNLVNEQDTDAFNSFACFGSLWFASYDTKADEALEIDSYLKCVLLPPIFPYDVLTSTKVSTVYRGTAIDRNNNICMKPLFSFKNSRILNMCFNSKGILALLLEERCALYDIKDEILEEINVTKDKNNILCASGNGFIIHNCKSSIIISRLYGPSLSKRYYVKTFELGNDDLKAETACSYSVVGEAWMRFIWTQFSKSCKLQIALNRNVTSEHSSKEIVWNPFPLPIPASEYRSDILNNRLFVTTFPKEKLRCDIYCPHCKANKRKSLLSFDDERDEYLYLVGDSSDIDSDESDEDAHILGEKKIYDDNYDTEIDDDDE